MLMHIVNSQENERTIKQQGGIKEILFLILYFISKNLILYIKTMVQL